MPGRAISPARLRLARNLKEGGKSSRTVQAYLTAIKGLTKWLVSNEKLPRDPLASIQKPNPKADRRYERRILLPGEWRWLRSVTLAGPAQYGISGKERLLLYAEHGSAAERMYEQIGFRTVEYLLELIKTS